MWQLDRALAQVLSTGNEPMISRIRLAWWREALERLDREKAPAEPVLQGLAEHVLPAGIAGAELAAMEEGWSVLLEPERLGPAELETYAQSRGGLLFHFSARLLGDEAHPVQAMGARWALVDLARHSVSKEDANAAIQMARAGDAGAWPARLRPLGMLGVLALRDAARGPEAWERPGAPRRMLRMIGHRLTGR